jgi:hypothetical protein
VLRRLAALLVLAAALAAAAPGAAGAFPAVDAAPSPAAAPRWAPGVAAARAYARARAGIVSFAIRTPRRTYGFRAERPARSASVVKAMLLVAYLRQASVRDRALTPAERALLGPMIRVSDNDAANRVFGVVGTPGLLGVARAAGMRSFVSGDGSWGASLVTAADQTRFFGRIDLRVPPRHRGDAMRLLRSISPAQRWGVAQVRPAGWALYFKGGWGSGSGAVDHQVALLTRGGARVSLAILTVGNPDMTYGNATLRGVAARLRQGLAGTLVGTVDD